MKRYFVVLTAFVLAVGLSFSSVHAGVTGDIQMVDQKPANVKDGAQVDAIERPESLTGGAIAEQSGDFSLSAGKVDESTLNAAGAVNIFSQDDEFLSEQSGDFDVSVDQVRSSTVNAIGSLNLATTEGDVTTVHAVQSGDFLFEVTGPKGIKVGSTVNAIGAANIAPFVVDASQDDLSIVADQNSPYRFLSQSPNNTISGGQVNAIAAMNYVPLHDGATNDPEGDATMEAFSNNFTFDHGNRIEFATVNAIGAMNIATLDAGGDAFDMTSMTALQEGKHKFRAGRIEGSKVNVIGAMNFAAVDQEDDVDMTAEQQGTFDAEVSGEVNDDHGAATVNFIGAMNLNAQTSQSGSLTALQSGTYNVSTGAIKGSTVNAVGAINFNAGGSLSSATGAGSSINSQVP